MSLLVVFESIAAVLLATLLWVTGFRRKVFRLNLELMNFNSRPGLQWLRWRLCFNASRDLIALLLNSGKTPAISTHDQLRLKKMKSGPSLLLTAHFHNWEFLGRELQRQGISLLAAAKPMQNLRAEKLLQGLRKRIGASTVNDNVPRNGLRHLQQGGCFALLWDQHAPQSESFGSFFDNAVQMNPLPEFLLGHGPCPVYFGVLLPGNNLRLITLLSAFEKGWEARLNQRYHRVLEILIQKHPEYYYGFFHARFKNITEYPGHRTSAIPLPQTSTRFSFSPSYPLLSRFNVGEGV